MRRAPSGGNSKDLRWGALGFPLIVDPLTVGRPSGPRRVLRCQQSMRLVGSKIENTNLAPCALLSNVGDIVSVLRPGNILFERPVAGQLFCFYHCTLPDPEFPRAAAVADESQARFIRRPGALAVGIVVGNDCFRTFTGEIRLPDFGV